jgi:integrase/recombinase XerD
MASLVKPWITSYRLPDGKRVKKGTPGARKKRERSKYWYAQYKDVDGWQRTRLCTDKTAALQQLAVLVRKAEQQRDGTADPFEEHRKRPLAEHLNDFEASLRNKGDSEEHVQTTLQRARAVVDGCGFRFIADLSASRVQAFIAELRRQQDLSIQSCNFYLSAVKQFAKWLVRDRRTADSPLAHLSGGNVKLDRRCDRRALTAEEFSRLMETTRTGRSHFKFSGRSRLMLYLTAAYVGLRAKELSGLTPRRFDFGPGQPLVTVEAAYAKNRREDTLPLHPGLAVMLQEWIKGLGLTPDDRLWPGNWAKNKEGGKLLKFDLARARVTWIAEGKTAEEQTRREASDFLVWRDQDGLVADFHALRHTYLTNLAKSGTSLKVIQSLARHSTITLTMDRYAHSALCDEAAALATLPPLPLATGPATLAATGTDAESLRSACAADEERRGSVRMAVGEPSAPTTGDRARQTPDLMAFDGVCGQMREAEGVGFEPTRACALLVFKTSAIGRSAIPPRALIYSGFRRICRAF